MRQRRGAAEQRQHQRQEVDPVGRLRAADALERRMLARPQHLAARGRFLVIDRQLRTVAGRDRQAAPQHHFRLLQRSQEFEGTQRPRFRDLPGQPPHMPHRVQHPFARPLPQLAAIHPGGPVRSFLDRLGLGQAIAVAPGGLTMKHRRRLSVGPHHAHKRGLGPGPLAGQQRSLLPPGLRLDVGERVSFQRFRDGELVPVPATTLHLQAPLQQQPHEDHAEQDQQRALQELHPRGRDHPRGHHDQDHHRTHQHHPHPVRQAQQGLHQHPGSHHLRNEVEQADRQRADPRRQLDPPRLKPRVESVGEGELPQPLHRLRDHEQCHHPARQVANRVQESVVAIEGDHPADPEERRRREVVTREGNPVHKPRNLPVSGEVALRRLGATAQVKTDRQRQPHEDREDAERRPRNLVNHGRVSARGVVPVSRQRKP